VSSIFLPDPRERGRLSAERAATVGMVTRKIAKLDATLAQ
jgi:hypothetical protein